MKGKLWRGQGQKQRLLLEWQSVAPGAGLITRQEAGEHSFGLWSEPVLGLIHIHLLAV